ncbi:uncharacterized protein EMH_0003610 [Eimeria mitis]|uniref:Retrotransposon gag domain-containing protein n=1 Tax=Eimeria mitis TaxID=44415 RepID=U6K0R8_9EIME|nr:uncharacterized protein EMH_0003610 [Eimeria mitis]CDJ29348.1 hypothetical protein EMH_0003610 [Eimeria mitis]
MQAFQDALRCRFIPRSAREQAMAELRKLKQGKLSIERCIEKYQSLVNRSPMVDAELHCNWFIARLAPEVRQTVTCWATDREMRSEKVELADMMKYLPIMEGKKATSTALAEKEENWPRNDPDLESMDIGAVNTKPDKHGARGGYLKGPREITAALTDPPQDNSVLVQVRMEVHDLMALLDTGCEVDMISGAAARRCSLPVYSLAQSLRLRFADGRQDTRIDKTMGVKCSISSNTGHIPMTRDFYVGSVHHGIILGTPWVTQWKAQMRSSDAAIEVIPPGSDECTSQLSQRHFHPLWFEMWRPCPKKRGAARLPHCAEVLQRIMETRTHSVVMVW